MNGELLEIILPVDLRYKWGAGFHLGTFLRGLKEGKIVANRCPQCGRLQLPPTNACGRCHIDMGEQWVELSHQGSVFNYSFVVDPIFDPGIADLREVPYTIAAIILEGGPDVAFFHRLEENDPDKIRAGMRVEAVFKPPQEREGTIEDIIHFRTID